jgi:hypothetical protein
MAGIGIADISELTLPCQCIHSHDLYLYRCTALLLYLGLLYFHLANSSWSTM